MIRRYTKDDYNEIMGWAEKRRMKIPEPRYLPGVGFIEPGVGVCFLYQTDSDYCLLDILITNPDATLYSKDCFIKDAGPMLINYAKNMDYGVIKADSSIRSVCREIEALGFVLNGTFKSYVRKL